MDAQQRHRLVLDIRAITVTYKAALGDGASGAAVSERAHELLDHVASTVNGDREAWRLVEQARAEIGRGARAQRVRARSRERVPRHRRLRRDRSANA